MRTVLATTAVLAAATANAQVAQVTADKWIKLCSEGAPLTDLVSCGSYARGVADMIEVLRQSAPDVWMVCIPQNKTANDLATAAFPLIVKLPASDRAKPAVILLWGAFLLAYPCRKDHDITQSAPVPPWPSSPAPERNP